MVHDQDFYIGGADCVIRVENTLFNVSDVILCFILLVHRFAAKSLAPWTFANLTSLSQPIWIFVCSAIFGADSLCAVCRSIDSYLRLNVGR